MMVKCEFSLASQVFALAIEPRRNEEGSLRQQPGLMLFC